MSAELEEIQAWPDVDDLPLQRLASLFEENSEASGMLEGSNFRVLTPKSLNFGEDKPSAV